MFLKHSSLKRRCQRTSLSSSREQQPEKHQTRDVLYWSCSYTVLSLPHPHLVFLQPARQKFMLQGNGNRTHSWSPSLWGVYSPGSLCRRRPLKNQLWYVRSQCLSGSRGGEGQRLGSGNCHGCATPHTTLICWGYPGTSDFLMSSI